MTEMHKQYRIMGGAGSKSNNDDDDDVVETSLTNFGGHCYHCGKKGHKKNKCPLLKTGSGNPRNNNNSRKQKGKKKFKGNCNHCGKEGHKEADCWEKHPEKKPAKFKKKADTAGANVEVLVANIAVPIMNDQKPSASESVESLLGTDEGLL